MRIVLAFLATPPAVGLVATLTVSWDARLFWPATLVAGIATFILGLPTFLVLEETRRTSLRIYLGKGALLGVVVAALVDLPALLALPTSEEVVLLAGAILGIAVYCAFLGMVAAAVFWIIARPDRAPGRITPGEPIWK